MTSSFPYVFLLFCSLFLIAIPTEAQFGLNLSHSPTLPSSQWVNPANISQQEYHNIQIDFSGDFWLSNNRFTLEKLIREGNFLSEETKTILIDQMDSDNEFQQGNKTNFLLNFSMGDHNWLLSYQRGQSLFIGLGDSVSAGLFLRGNAPYAGQEISDDRVEWRSFSYRAIGIGSSWSDRNFTGGFHLKFLQGIRSQIVDRLAYALLTARDGSQISLDADYSTQGTLEDNQGWGIGIDLGMRYTFSNQHSLEFALNSLGGLQWEGSKSENVVNIDYRGVEWDNFLTNSGSTSNLSIGDTLQQLLFPDSVRTQFSTPFPAFVRVAYTMGHMQSGKLGISLTQSLTQWAPQTPLPILNFMYSRGNDRLSGGLNGFIGGMDAYGFGLWGTGNIPIGEEAKLGIYASMPNVLGLAIPDISRGLDLRGGVYLSW